MTTFKVIMTAVLAAAAMQGVAAADGGAPMQQAVSFADLDLSGAAGARTLYGRLKGAARQVCAQLDGKSPAQQQRYRGCVAEAISNAVATVNEPTLTEVYLVRSGRTAASARVAARR